MSSAAKIEQAMLGSFEAILRVRKMKESAAHSPPRAATGHMPFPGHRTMATVWAQQDAAFRRAKDYGFDRESLKKGRG